MVSPRTAYTVPSDANVMLMGMPGVPVLPAVIPPISAIIPPVVVGLPGPLASFCLFFAAHIEQLAQQSFFAVRAGLGLVCGAGAAATATGSASTVAIKLLLNIGSLLLAGSDSVHRHEAGVARARRSNTAIALQNSRSATC